MKRRAFTILAIVVPLLILTGGAVASLESGEQLLPGTFPDRVAYPAHVIAGEALNHIGIAPSAAGTAWIKAASHARTAGQIRRAAEGLATARRQSQGAPRFTEVTCGLIDRGSPAARAAAYLAGSPCRWLSPENIGGPPGTFDALLRDPQVPASPTRAAEADLGHGQ